MKNKQSLFILERYAEPIAMDRALKIKDVLSPCKVTPGAFQAWSICTY